MRGRVKTGGCSLAVACALLLLTAQVAAADHSFCPFGDGPGQCDGPQGVAVEEASGNVYVADRGHARVNVFDSSGPLLFSFGTSGNGPGQFGPLAGIAIDNDPTSPSYRAVYVGTDNFRVQKFDRDGNFLLAFGSQGGGPGQFMNQSDPIAIGPGGTVYVADSPSGSGALNHRIEMFSDTGAFLAACQMPPLDPPLSSQDQPFKDLVVDANGDVYVVYGVGFGVFKYEVSEPTCTPLGSFDAASEIQTRALSPIDASDSFYAYQSIDDVPIDFITKYTPAGSILSRFGYGAVHTQLADLAVSSASGDLFGSEQKAGQGQAEEGIGNRVVHIPAPPPGPIVVPGSVDADPVSNTKATLNAVINPEGEDTTYHFEYVDQQSFEESGFSGPAVKSTPESASIGSDFDLYPVSAQVGCLDPVNEASEGKCLLPDTTYRFRLIATNADGQGNSPLEAELTTEPPVKIEAAWPTDVGTDSARLHALVNPLGIPTTGYFEYVSEAAFQQGGFSAAAAVPNVPAGAPPLDLGAGDADVTASAFVADLAPGAYRFRVVVDDPLIDPLAGPDRVFATQEARLGSPPCANAQFRTGASAALPNCRAYELVSPLDKDNGDIIAVGNINGNPAQLNLSAAAGDKLTYSSYRAFGDAQSSPFTSQYLATRDPAQGWLTHGISPPRGVNILEKGMTLERQFKAFSEDLCTGWLLHDTDPALAAGAVEGFANLYRRQNCPPESDAYAALSTASPPNAEPPQYAPELQGVSADGVHAVFRVNDALTPNANPGKPVNGNYQCYDASGGKLRLVSVLPNGTANKQHCSIGTAYDVNDGRGDFVSNAISDDGSRIFWTASPGTTGPGQIFARIEAKNPTVAISGAVSKAAAQFWGAAANGSRVIFTIEDGDTTNQGDDLYEFDVDKEQEHLIAGEVEGVLGAGEDARRIYFVSREDLGEGASEGELNLYLYESPPGDVGPGAYRFIAALAEEDVPAQNNLPSPVSPEPYFHTARVTPSGLQAAFMTVAAPTGFDNADAASGEPAAEVYVYDVMQGGGELTCVSCNPTAARPAGRELRKSTGFGTGIWAAAQLPTFPSQLNSSRVLAESGQRLFFESYEGLVARDSNGVQDVYQWERSASRQDCEARGAELFVASSGGCLSLISSGESAKDSEFVDASTDGSDVFIATGSSLLPHDPGLIDIYDARLGGGFPPPPMPRPACQGEACQSPPPPPAETTAGSLVFRGKGNVTHRGRSCGKGKRKVRRGGRARCVKKNRGGERRKGGDRRRGR